MHVNRATHATPAGANYKLNYVQIHSLQSKRQ